MQQINLPLHLFLGSYYSKGDCLTQREPTLFPLGNLLIETEEARQLDCFLE